MLISASSSGGRGGVPSERFARLTRLPTVLACYAFAVALLATLAAGGNHPVARTLFAPAGGLLLAVWLAWMLARPGGGGGPLARAARSELPSVPGFLPAVLGAAWVLLSLVPLPGEVLGALSPSASALRSLGVAGDSTAGVAGPLSLAAGHTFQALSLDIAAWAVFAVLATCVRRRRVARALVLLLCAEAFLQGMLGCHQVFSNAHASGAQATGTFIGRNQLAFLLVVCFLGGVGLLLDRLAPEDRGRNVFKPSWIARFGDARVWRWVLFGIALAIVAAALVLTASRGAALSCVLGLSLLVARLLTRRGGVGLRAAAVLAVLVLAATSWTGVSALARRFTTGDPERESPRVRLDAWQGALRMVRAFPLAGVGLGAYPEVNAAFQSDEFPQFYLVHAHSDPLELAAEVGLPGIALAVWFTAALARAVWRRARSAGGVPLGIAGALVAGAAHSLVDFPFHVPGDLFPFAALAGIAVAPCWEREGGGEGEASGERGEGRTGSRRRGRTALAVAGPLGVLVVPGLLAVVAARQVDRFRIEVGAAAESLAIPAGDSRVFGSGMGVFRTVLPRLPATAARALLPELESAADLCPWMAEAARAAGRMADCATEDFAEPTATPHSRIESSKRLDRGEVLFRRAIALDPVRAHTHLELGWLLSKRAAVLAAARFPFAEDANSGVRDPAWTDPSSRADRAFLEAQALAHDPAIFSSAAAWWRGRLRSLPGAAPERRRAADARVAAEAALLRFGLDNRAERVRNLWRETRSYDLVRRAIEDAGLADEPELRLAFSLALGRSGAYPEADAERRAGVSSRVKGSAYAAAAASRAWREGRTAEARTLAEEARGRGGYIVAMAPAEAAVGAGLPAPGWLHGTAVLALALDRLGETPERVADCLADLASWVQPGEDGRWSELDAALREVAARRGVQADASTPLPEALRPFLAGRMGTRPVLLAAGVESKRVLRELSSANPAATQDLSGWVDLAPAEGAGGVSRLRLEARCAPLPAEGGAPAPPVCVTLLMGGVEAGSGFLESGLGSVEAEAVLPRGGIRLEVLVRQHSLAGVSEPIRALDLPNRIELRLVPR
ncbi:MAG: O-antigen ligase family protein [Planctomycetes bacterium]|nr:O-antigen ligase family protein [Planctomycetota bacterium]